jgi:hypothetical protein
MWLQVYLVKASRARNDTQGVTHCNWRQEPIFEYRPGRLWMDKSGRVLPDIGWPEKVALQSTAIDDQPAARLVGG